MTYIQPSIIRIGMVLEHVNLESGFKGSGSCRDSQSAYLSSQGAYELDE